MIAHVGLLFLFFLHISVGGLVGSSHSMPILRLMEEDGDTRIEIEQAPWQVAVVNRQSGKLLCGGSIISPNYVLTIAHCTDLIKTEDMYIRHGSKFWDKGGSSTPVLTAMRHPRYDAITFDNDIAVLRVSSPMLFNARQHPVALSTHPPQFKQVARITGYGEGKDLTMAHTDVANLTACNDAYADVGLFISDNQFCTMGYYELEVDLCDGDEGSGLTNDGVLIGVASWGMACRLPQRDFHDVYTRVDLARDFIDENSNYEAIWTT